MKSFGISRLAFDLEATEPISLPSYKGSAFRGGFGHAFKKAACALSKQDCDACLLRERCVYSYVFETRPLSGSVIMRKYPRAPHPFVLEPPEEDQLCYDPGERMGFGLVLIGRAIDHLPYFIYGFDLLGRIGIGRGRGKFLLRTVKSLPPERIDCESREGEEGSIIYDGSSKTLRSAPVSRTWEELLPRFPPFIDRVTLSFKTPTRIRYDDRYILELEFHILIRNLLRRISTLSYFHCGESLGIDFRGLIDRAKGVVTEQKDLHWLDWERYSARQDARMKMGGFVGQVTFRGDLGPFRPFLVLGQVIHVGKGTSFGLGRYEIL